MGDRILDNHTKQAEELGPVSAKEKRFDVYCRPRIYAELQAVEPFRYDRPACDQVGWIG